MQFDHDVIRLDGKGCNKVLSERKTDAFGFIDSMSLRSAFSIFTDAPESVDGIHRW